VDFRFDLLFETRDADHEELVEVGPVDRDELQPLEQRVALVERFFEHAVVDRDPRQLAIDVERRIVERRNVPLGAELLGGLRIRDHRG
jgi:hypothetical protein